MSTRLGPPGLRPVIEECLGLAGVAGDLPEAARGRVELSVRHDSTDEFWFFVNLTAPADRLAVLPPRGVAVVRRPGRP